MNKTYLIDLDGTMYRGKAIIEGAKEFIDFLYKTNQQYIFFTNNSSRTLKQNKEHMQSLGFEHIEDKNFFTSALAAASYVRKHYEGRKAFYVGMDGLKEALELNGFEICDYNADFVFIGLDKQGTYDKYSQALQNLLNGAILVGTNNDRIILQEDGPHVGNGSIVALFEYATNTKSLEIGKPHRAIVDECIDHFKLNKEDCIIIGDNLETDILCGINAGIETILVMSGVHNESDIEKYHIKPDRCIKSLCELIKE